MTLDQILISGRLAKLNEEAAPDWLQKAREGAFGSKEGGEEKDHDYMFPCRNTSEEAAVIFPHWFG